MDADSKKQKQQKKKGKQERSTGRWAVQVFFIAVVLSAALSLASDQALDGAGLAVAFAVLLAFNDVAIPTKPGAKFALSRADFELRNLLLFYLPGFVSF